MAGAALFSELAGRSFAGHDSTIKVALVGCGFRGTGAATQVLSTRGPVKLWAMADLFHDRLQSSYHRLVHGIQADYDREASAGFAARIDVPPERRFVGFDAYQKAIDSGVDLVLLTTNQHFRPAHFAYAVDRGKHVFMEKPLGVDVPGIHQLLAANEEAKKKNLKVGVGLVMRHTRHVQECIRRVKEGAIGPVGLMCCYFNFSGLRETPPRPDDMTEMTYQLRNPYHFQWLSGDYIVDAVVHYLDLALWLHGNPPVTAQGQGGRQAYLPNFQGDTFDHIVVEYTFDDRTKLFAKRGRCPAAGSNRPCTLTARRVALTSSTDVSTANRPGTRVAANPTLTKWSTTCWWRPSVATSRTTTSTGPPRLRCWASWVEWPPTPGRRSPGSRCSIRRFACAASLRLRRPSSGGA